LWMLRLYREEQFLAVTTSSADNVAYATGYNGLPSFEFVSAPADCYERRHAFNLVTSNLLRPSQVQLRPLLVRSFVIAGRGLIIIIK